MPIQPVSPERDRLVGLERELEWLADDLGADASAFGHGWFPAEGPVWWQEGGCLLFSDIGKSKRMKWSPGTGLSVEAENTNEANGMTRDLEGRLVI